MKSINKRCLSLIMVMCILVTILVGCGNEISIKQAYSYYSLSATGNAISGSQMSEDGGINYLSESLCVTDENNINVDAIDNVYIGAGGVFDLNNKEVLYGYNLFEEKYPASTTKVLTAYVVLKYCDLNEQVTISENAVNLPEGAVTSGISVGDVLTVQDLLYALMLLSGNDAAIALAEHVSGSVDEFAKLMTKEAHQLGATNSNFINPNGLHGDEHYTTVYDLYLILNAAIQSEVFVEIINTTTYTAVYQSVRGSTVETTYSNTNHFLTGEEEYPDNYIIIGGKTGTTYEAGKCLVLYVEDEDGNPYILIGLGCDTRERLYDYLEDQMEFINKLNEK